jgi:predicted amidophosphoribosyltransferase
MGGLVALALQFCTRRHKQRITRQYLQQQGIPVCINCGYDLRAQTTPRCPECGEPFDPKLLSPGRDSRESPTE